MCAVSTSATGARGLSGRPPPCLVTLAHRPPGRDAYARLGTSLARSRRRRASCSRLRCRESRAASRWQSRHQLERWSRVRLLIGNPSSGRSVPHLRHVFVDTGWLKAIWLLFPSSVPVCAPDRGRLPAFRAQAASDVRVSTEDLPERPHGRSIIASRLRQPRTIRPPDRTSTRSSRAGTRASATRRRRRRPTLSAQRWVKFGGYKYLLRRRAGARSSSTRCGPSRR